MKVLLLTLVVFVNSVFSENKTKCYDELGCFPMGEPWSSFWRPMPAPQSPTTISTRISCFTRDSADRYNVTLWPAVDLNGLPFKAERTTVFITHGFGSNGEERWVHRMKDAYLRAADANVCLVDWQEGAAMMNYLQVGSNTRIVGAEIARFIRFLQREHGLSASKLHLIGHSLGAHTSSYAAKNITGTARITGLDVAQPGFEGYDEAVRLDKSDAEFVDAVHTNGAAFFPNRGLGFIDPVGHVDFYMNGGRKQPGCKMVEVFSSGLELVGLSSIGSFTVENLVEWSGCNHGRSFEYFIEALNENCPMWGLASTMNYFKVWYGNTHAKSRSHCIFTVRLLRYPNADGPNRIIVSSFAICDLAVAERQKKTLNEGLRLKESQNINSSLHVLSRCFSVIRENQLNNENKMVPFRDLKLTQLFLQHALQAGGR